MPKVPPAPPTFSTTSVWPSVRDIWSPTRRVTTSVGPPAANGTMTVIGLFGYWAAAGALCNESASRLPAIRRYMSAMVFLPPTRRRDDERRAPFAQVRLAASVLVRAEALVAKDAPLKETDFALPLIPAARYSQHDGGNSEIYQCRACMARHGQQE